MIVNKYIILDVVKLELLRTVSNKVITFEKKESAVLFAQSYTSEWQIIEISFKNE